MGSTIDDLSSSVEALGVKIADAVKWHHLEDEKTTAQARGLLGPHEFEVVRRYGTVSNFALLDSDEFITNYDVREGQGAYNRHLLGITHLCHIGLLGLHTAKPKLIKLGQFSIEFSYHWKGLGNQVIATMGIISEQDVRERAEGLPPHFE